jgi:hypothetical protein
MKAAKQLDGGKAIFYIKPSDGAFAPLFHAASGKQYGE